MPSETDADDAAIGRAISSDPAVLSGTLVFAGTRVPVDALFENILDGMSVDEFLVNFPTVERWQVATVIRFGARSLGSGVSSDPKGGQ